LSSSEKDDIEEPMGRDKLKILTFGVKNDQISGMKKVDGS
jgi:hypothetical protein